MEKPFSFRIFERFLNILRYFFYIIDFFLIWNFSLIQPVMGSRVIISLMVVSWRFCSRCLLGTCYMEYKFVGFREKKFASGNLAEVLIEEE